MSGFVFRRRVKLDDHTTANVSKGGASVESATRESDCK